MSTERGVRFMAGSMILISLALGQWVSHYWLLLTLFAGLNLFQSSLTNWCPAESVLKTIGFGGGACTIQPTKVDMSKRN